MQTIANNFISGLLLLIERPLRSGDTVQIGSNIGEISRIGIRSLTMKTWDNMEVIIPNSDVVTTAFTNWTHSDNIVRTKLMIGVRYDADPHLAKEMMSRVLKNHKDVVREPQWSVLLWEFGDSVITFRVQYYTDFFKSNILDVHSEVMFAIYDGLKRAGIGIPNAQRDLRIKEWPEGVAMVRSADAASASPPTEKPAVLDPAGVPLAKHG
jgi:potassium efflux system protein